MKKIILCLFAFILFIPFKVMAGSANISISGPSSVYVGDTVKISVTLSSSESLGSWNYNISYDDSKFQYVSTTANAAQSVADYVSGDGKKSVTYSWTYKATAAGSASFSVSGIDVYAFDESQLSVGGSTKKTIEIKNPNPVSGNNGGSNNKPSQNYNYSTNNNLKSLSVEGFDFEFDKNKTEYSISVPNETTSVKIGATAEDGKARVNGIGDFEVKEGDNVIEVVVTAENGDKKTYKLNVVVAEATPIEVTVGDNTYNVVRKSDLLPTALATFEASTTLIKGEEVPCYHSSITDFYLIGLRDSDGNIDLYRYDAKEDKFYVYNQLQLGGIYIALLDGDAPDGYKLDKVKINEKEYSAFTKDGAYPLLYGVNLETGEKNYYSYDSNEGTIQKLLQTASAKTILDSPYLVYGLIGLCVLEFVMLIISVSSKNRKLKKILKSKTNSVEFNGIIDESADNDDYDDSESDDTEEFEDTSDDIDEETSEEISEPEKKVDHVSDERFGYTAYVADSVTDVFNSSKKEKKISKKKKKSNDDEMFQF